METLKALVILLASLHLETCAFLSVTVAEVVRPIPQGLMCKTRSTKTDDVVRAL